jgi:hypothetical protein
MAREEEQFAEPHRDIIVPEDARIGRISGDSRCDSIKV